MQSVVGFTQKLKHNPPFHDGRLLLPKYSSAHRPDQAIVGFLCNRYHPLLHSLLHPLPEPRATQARVYKPVNCSEGLWPSGQGYLVAERHEISGQGGGVLHTEQRDPAICSWQRGHRNGPAVAHKWGMAEPTPLGRTPSAYDSCHRDVVRKRLCSG